jgi:gliding motility-associated-like protein
VNKRLTLLVLTLFALNFAYGQTFTQSCIADSRLSRNDACPWSVINYGTATTTQAATWTWVGPGCGQGDIRSIFQFDLNPATTPQSLYDNRATLNLYFPTGSTETHFYTGAGTDNQFYIQRVNTAWAENTITWDNQAGFTTTGQILVPSASTNPSTVDYNIDISGLAYEWICNSQPNYGVRLALLNEGNTYRRVTFTTREWADPLKRPTLTLEYAYIAASAPDTICGGASFSIACALNNASNPANYVFSWEHINSSTTYNSQDVVNPAYINGLNTYVVTVSNPWCQTATDTVQVFIDSSATITVSPTSTSVCSGSSVTLSASGASTYSWSTGGSGSSISVSPTSNTTYTVTGTTIAGCTSTANATVSMNPNPTISVSNQTICSGQSATLSASGAATYSWSTGGTNSSISVSPTNTTVYTVTGTNAVGCTGTTSATVTVNPLPTISISASPTSVCSGNQSTLTASGGSTYSWSTGGTGTTANVSPTTTTSYSVTGTSAAGCTNTASVSVSVLAGPVVLVSDTSICEGQSVVVAASGATNYSWNNGSSGSSITVSPTNTTSYTVSGTDGSGCTGVATATVTVNMLPTITVADIEICEGDTGILSANGGSSYLWSTGQTGQNINVNPLNTSTYYLTGTDVNGCENTDSALVSVNPLPVISIATTDDFCNNQNGTAIANTTGATAPYSYVWNTNPVQTNDTASNLPAGNYSVTVTDSKGCTGIASANIQSVPGFTLSSASESEHCNLMDGIAIVFVNGTSNPLNFSWAHNPVLNNDTASGIASGTYTVTVDDGLCTDSISIDVSSISGPTAGFILNPSVVNMDNPFVNIIDQSFGSSFWYYDLDDGNSSNLASFTHTYSSDGNYLVMQIVSDTYGCSDTAYQSVMVRPSFSIYIPNAFSPNGDGTNDYFHPYATGIDLNSYEMRIYDRWGRIVFLSTDINNTWDGNYDKDSNFCNSSVFTYRIAFIGADGNNYVYFGKIVRVP